MQPEIFRICQQAGVNNKRRIQKIVLFDFCIDFLLTWVNDRGRKEVDEVDIFISHPNHACSWIGTGYVDTMFF